MHSYFFTFFFFNDTATTEIYTLSLHDALPISHRERLPRGAASAAGALICGARSSPAARRGRGRLRRRRRANRAPRRSEEHTSELQSRQYLVCRLLLEKKKKNTEWHTCAETTSE